MFFFFFYKPLYVTHNIPLFSCYLIWIESPFFSPISNVFSFSSLSSPNILWFSLSPFLFSPWFSFFPYTNSFVHPFFTFFALTRLISFYQLSLFIPELQHSFVIQFLLFRWYFPCVLFIPLSVTWFFLGRTFPLSTHSYVSHQGISGLLISRY